MSFLIAEIIGLLALAAACGGAFVYWWARRHFVDVSSEYARFETVAEELDTVRKREVEAMTRVAALEAERDLVQMRLNDELDWRSQIGGKLDQLRPLSLHPVLTRMKDLSISVARIQPADLASVESKLDALERRVAGIETTDVSHLESGIAAVSVAVSALKPADLSTINKKLADLDSRVTELHNTNFARLETSVGSVRKAVAGIKPADMRVVETRLADVDKTVRRRLDAVEKALKARPVTKRSAAPTSRRKPRKATRLPGSNLLEAPSHGDPDDLKRISGVGPKLEKMLHGIGVYYFWQVAEWNKADVKHVDDQLRVFKGRIGRDQWVKQAASLARQAGSAKLVLSGRST